EAYKKSVKRSFARLRTLEGARREEILDATYPWQNRGADGAGPMDAGGSARTGMDPDARQRIRSAVLGAHAALRRGA
ncbi:MAG TPA: hypothetical protein VFX50_00345, partial [Gemmatimonadales bacterium]|nr:hypothetical protein [Gemmatimonadales bacterium]